MYTKEQEERISQLRAERENEKNKRIQEREREEAMKKRHLDVGSSVYVTIDGKTVSGYIVNKNDEWRFDVKTPYGIVRNVDVFKGEIRGRLVQDLSQVEIPEEVKKCTTGRLLSLLNAHRKPYGYWSTPEFTEEQIKAELKNRPHVPTKGEKRIYEKRIKNQKAC